MAPRKGHRSSKQWCQATHRPEQGSNSIQAAGIKPVIERGVALADAKPRFQRLGTHRRRRRGFRILRQPNSLMPSAAASRRQSSRPFCTGTQCDNCLHRFPRARRIMRRQLLGFSNKRPPESITGSACKGSRFVKTDADSGVRLSSYPYAHISRPKSRPVVRFRHASICCLILSTCAICAGDRVFTAVLKCRVGSGCGSA